MLGRRVPLTSKDTAEAEISIKTLYHLSGWFISGFGGNQFTGLARARGLPQAPSAQHAGLARAAR